MRYDCATTRKVEELWRNRARAAALEPPLLRVYQ
jgi:hypothetical protein